MAAAVPVTPTTKKIFFNHPELPPEENVTLAPAVIDHADFPAPLKALIAANQGLEFAKAPVEIALGWWKRAVTGGYTVAQQKEFTDTIPDNQLGDVINVANFMKLPALVQLLNQRLIGLLSGQSPYQLVALLKRVA